MKRLVVVVFVLLAACHALPAPSWDAGDDELDVQGDIELAKETSASALADMNGEVSPSSLMPSTSQPGVVMSDGNAPTASSAFDDMEGEHEASGVVHPTNIGAPHASASTPAVKQATPPPPSGVEVDMSMPVAPQSVPVVAQQANNMPAAGDDEDFEPTPEMEAKMRANSYEPSNMADEEAKMNGMNDAVVAEEDDEEAKRAVISAADRMNTVMSSNGNGMGMGSDATPAMAYPTAGAAAFTTAQADAGSPLDDEEDADSAMNADQMNSAQGGSALKMNAGSPVHIKLDRVAAAPAVVQADEPSAFDTMNALKAHPQSEAEAMNIPPVQHIEMPSKSSPQVVMPPEPANDEDQSLPIAQNDMEMSSPDSEQMNSQASRAQMPSTSAPDVVMSEGDAVAVPAVHAAEAVMSEPAAAPPAAPVAPAAVAVPELAMSNGDGDAMGDMSRLHPAAVQAKPTRLVETPGFMDAGEGDSASFASEMNTVTPGLDMMGTAASFLMEEAEQAPAPAPAPVRPAAPFYNQYAPATSQPKPFAPPDMQLPVPTHPYGMPYFHRDPFMPLQTPYYHIPAFDNPNKNPALTPFYNPYVNPPPPLPPTVPAAPSFFPYHHPQHMIPPYFPYPPAPVLQPGPFPPFALPSHLQPGKMYPSAKFSKLPEKHSEDPF